MSIFATKRLPALVVAATLPFLASGVLASGTHSGGHSHGQKASSHETMEKKGHEHGHDQASIDYSSVEEHEFGKASDPASAKQTVTVDMNDSLRFEPAEVRVKVGETVRFVVRNKGQLMHEMVLGTDASLQEHAKLMMKFPGMEHDEPHMAHVEPGKEYTMGWQFTKAGVYDYGCLVPGHFEAGMRGKVIVE